MKFHTAVLLVILLRLGVASSPTPSPPPSPSPSPSTSLCSAVNSSSASTFPYCFPTNLMETTPTALSLMEKPPALRNICAPPSPFPSQRSYMLSTLMEIHASHAPTPMENSSTSKNILCTSPSPTLSTRMEISPVSSPSPHTVCGWKSWRDHVFFFDYIGFGIFIIYTSFSWYIIVCYDTEDRLQSYYYLVTMVLTMTTTWFYPIADDSTWNIAKFYVGVIGSVLCLALDSAVYSHYGHRKWNLIFFALMTGVAIVVPKVGSHPNRTKKLAQILPILSKSSNILSALILIAGYLFSPAWDYVWPEVVAAVLGLLYTICGVIDSCDRLNLVLVIVAIAARGVYAVLLCTHKDTRGIAIWGSYALFASSMRKFTPFKDVLVKSYKLLKDDMKKKWVLMQEGDRYISFILRQLARFHLLPAGHVPNNPIQASQGNQVGHQAATDGTNQHVGEIEMGNIN